MCLLLCRALLLLAAMCNCCLELVVLCHFLTCGTLQNTAAGFRCVVPFGRSFPLVVMLSYSARNCLRNRYRVA